MFNKTNNSSNLSTEQVLRATGHQTSVSRGKVEHLSKKLNPSDKDRNPNGFMASRPTTGGSSRGPRPR